MIPCDRSNAMPRTELQVCAQYAREYYQKQVPPPPQAVNQRYGEQIEELCEMIHGFHPEAESAAEELERLPLGITDFKSVPAKRLDSFMQVLESIRAALNAIAQEWIARRNPVGDRLNAEDRHESSHDPQLRVPSGLPARRRQEPRPAIATKTRSPRALAR